jgi:flagellar secretion chaperone FliS
MYDQTAQYRAAQIATASPAGRVVLLYEGAIRFGTQHIACLQRGDLAGAHDASMRSQQIVGALQESLDLRTGPVAQHLDSIYRFVLDRLIAGNVAKDPTPTVEALELLRDLLPAWREVAGAPAAGALTAAASTVMAGATTVRVFG